MAGTLTIDLQAIRENWRICNSKSPTPCETAAVVKADAYGLGASEIAPALWEKGVRTFFVATLDEAVELRALLTDARIIALNGLEPGEEALYLEKNFIPVLNSLEETERANAFAHRAAKRLPVFLHIDTGMNRLGIEARQVEDLAGNQILTDGLKIENVMSHFACADESHPLNNQQYEAFCKLSEFFPDAKKSLANSPGIFRNDKYSFDLNRPGMALYGLNPSPDNKNPMHPAAQLKIPILHIRSAQKNESAGYGATYKFKNETPLAVAALGYADGFLRSLSNEGHLYWKHYALPIRGRVSMDLTIVDLSGVPEEEHPKAGDFLEVIGEHQSADDLADQAGTIGYEILTALGKRYKRSYI